MVEYSQNGFTAGDRSVIVTLAVPGTNNVLLPVRTGPAGQLLIAAAARWHRDVEPLITPGCWGYAYRSVRGSTTDLSNHASGTAIDLNAPKHPLGTDPGMNFTPAQIAAVRRIVDDARGALRWGGDYGVPARGGVAGSRPDGMHLEVNADEAACAAALPSVVMSGVSTSQGVLMALTDDEQKELLAGIRALKPGVRYDARSVNCRIRNDDQYGHTMSAEAEAADARVIAAQALAEVKALRAELAAHGTAGDPAAFATAVAVELAARLKEK